MSAGVGERSLVSCDLGGADERLEVGVLVGDGDRAASVADGFVDPTAPERDSGSDDGAIHGEDTVMTLWLAATIARASSHRPSTNTADAAYPVSSEPPAASIPNLRACSIPTTASRATSS